MKASGLKSTEIMGLEMILHQTARTKTQNETIEVPEEFLPSGMAEVPTKAMVVKTTMEDSGGDVTKTLRLATFNSTRMGALSILD